MVVWDQSHQTPNFGFSGLFEATNTRHSGVSRLELILNLCSVSINTRHSGVYEDYQALNVTLLAALAATNSRHGGVSD